MFQGIIKAYTSDFLIRKGGGNFLCVYYNVSIVIEVSSSRSEYVDFLYTQTFKMRKMTYFCK